MLGVVLICVAADIGMGPLTGGRMIFLFRMFELRKNYCYLLYGGGVYVVSGFFWLYRYDYVVLCGC